MIIGLFVDLSLPWIVASIDDHCSVSIQIKLQIVVHREWKWKNNIERNRLSSDAESLHCILLVSAFDLKAYSRRFIESLIAHQVSISIDRCVMQIHPGLHTIALRMGS